MGELFPLLAGVLAGVVTMRLSGAKPRTACIAVIGVVFGLIATAVNGESLLLVPVDATIVVLTAFAILAGPQLWARLRPEATRRESRIGAASLPPAHPENTSERRS
jgi:peptidoglycan/LPS O-acetylase OafA/YrhL